ncbi:MAG: hypothetical protein ABI652_09280 [Acidobacteriota bacterium]
MDKPTPDAKPQAPHSISDEHLGAVEGDQASDTPKGNRNVDAHGRPKNKNAVFEDVLGANNDGTEG